LLLPTVAEKSVIQYGGFSANFPGSYPHNPFPGHWQQYGHNYNAGFAAHAGLVGPYSGEYTDFLSLYGHPAYPQHFGLPAVLLKTEEIVIEKPISTGYYGYPGRFGYPNHFGYSPIVEKTEEIVIEKPISTGYYGYPGHFGYPNHFGYSPIVKETEEIVIEKPISTGYYGYPKHY
jgi:hypothetical protein